MIAGEPRGSEGMDGGHSQLFVEDFNRGQKFQGTSRNITEADVLSFAALTGDCHPIHYDANYARTTRFGRPVAHGLHLTALTALGAASISKQLEASMVALLEQNTKFLNPVFVDDTVRSEFEVEDVKPRQDKGWGTLRIAVRLVNQRGERVLEGEHVYRLRCRGKTVPGG
jgi:3-hydroxybutyryl-CoA dehydratase